VRRPSSAWFAVLVAFAPFGGSEREQPFVDIGVASGRCATCHLTEYLAVKRPMHLDAKPTTCGVCHASTSWHPAILNHSWSLTGAHQKANCFACHVGNPSVFQGTRADCVDCHRKDYDGSRFLGHDRFPLTCGECHSTTAWKPTLSEPPAAPAAPSAPLPSSAPPAAAAPPKPQQVTPVATARPATPARPTAPGKSPDNVSGASRRARH
jgi:hypothetical protein